MYLNFLIPSKKVHLEKQRDRLEKMVDDLSQIHHASLVEAPDAAETIFAAGIAIRVAIQQLNQRTYS